MDLNKINLPSFLIADLFKDSLVMIEDEVKSPKKNSTGNHIETEKEAFSITEKKDKEATPQQKKLSFLGYNQKHICIVVKDAEAIHLQDDLLQILSAILSACKLNLADVAIVNTETQTVTDTILRNELSPKTVLLFSVETKMIDLPFSIPMYKQQPFNNCIYMQSASLNTMKGNSIEAKVEKSKLWVCLKNIFGI